MGTHVSQPMTVAPDTPTTGRRDRSRDGLRFRTELHLTTRYRRVWRTLWRVPPVRRALNRFVINNVVGKAAARPYRLSTMGDHTSWESLVDRSYSGRHLPPGQLDSRSLPTVAEVGELFA